MRALSLERRVLVSILLTLALGIACVAWYLHGMRDGLRRSVMFIQAHEIAAPFIASGDTASLPSAYAGGELSYTLYSAQGQALWFSANLERPRRLRKSRLKDEHKVFWNRRNSGRIINVAVPLADGGTLMIAKEDRLEREAIVALLRARITHSLIFLIPAALLFIILIRLLLIWTFSPVKRAAQQAERIGPGQPERIPENRLPVEILPLAQAANGAMDRLSHALELERQIVADAAHELRTPLTVLDLRLQEFQKLGSIDWDLLQNDMRQMRRLIDQLLLLARQEQEGAADAMTSCSLAAVARQAVADMLPVFENAGRQLETDIRGDALVRGDPGILREVMLVLLDNALAHGQGKVTLRLHEASEGEVLLDVEDEGAGVPLQDQDAFFQRFAKGVQGSPGSGLGLSIAYRIMRNIGGGIRFVSNSPCVVRLRLAHGLCNGQGFS